MRTRHSLFLGLLLLALPVHAVVTGMATLTTPPRSTLIDGVAGRDALSSTVTINLTRQENTAQAPTDATVSIEITAVLTDTVTNLPVPLVQSTFTSTATIASHNGPFPAFVNAPLEINVKPAPGTRLQVEHEYSLALTTVLTDNDAVVRPLGTLTVANKYLHLSGTLWWGPVEARFTEVNDQASSLIDPQISGEIWTSIRIPAVGGSLANLTGFSFGDADVSIPVQVLPNGDVTVRPSLLSMPVIIAAGASVTKKNISFTPSNLTLDHNGGHGSISLRLPVGMGLASKPKTRRYVDEIVFTDVQLLAGLVPESKPYVITPEMVEAVLGLLPSDMSGYVPPAQLFVAVEDLPVRLPMASIEWNPSAGRFVGTPTAATYTLASEKAALAALAQLNVITSAEAQIHSNQGYWASAAPVNEIVVRGDAHGQAQMDGTFVLGAGGYYPHFPAQTWVPFTGGELHLNAGEWATADCFLTGVSSIVSGYLRGDGLEDPCSAALAPGVLNFVPADQKIHLTADGGWIADGTLSSAHTLGFGAYPDNGNASLVHQIASFTTASLHLPGIRLSGSVVTSSVDARPASMLFSGFGSPTDATLVERPGTAGYEDGLANYAGVNFRCVEGVTTSTSVIARQPLDPMPLRARSKFYARMAGVSGLLHPTNFTPRSLSLYGFPGQLTSFQLTFLDNANVDSAINGQIAFPGPAGFGLSFEKMKLRASGDLDHAELAANQTGKYLRYWGLTFDPLALSFTPPGDCLPGNLPTLPLPEIGITARLPGVTGTALAGKFSFTPEGDIVPGNTGRLTLPTALSLAGPGVSKFSVRPISAFALNRWRGSPHDSGGAYDQGHNGKGFGSFFAAVDVPYFEDLKAHIHVSPARTRDPWFISNGEALTLNNKTAFEVQDVDPQQHGFVGVTANDLDRYHEPDQLHSFFAPRAKKRWLDMINFSYPVVWNSEDKVFVTPAWLQTSADLKVLSVSAAIDRLAPQAAELSFGATYRGLPRINTKAMVSDALEQGNGMASALQDAAAAALTQAGQSFQPINIAGSLQRFESVLSDRLHDVVDQTLGQAAASATGTLYDTVKQGFEQSADAAARADYLLNGGFNAAFDTANQTITAALATANQSVNQAEGLVKHVSDTLTQARTGVAELKKLVQRPAGLTPGLPRPVFSQLVNQLIRSPKVIPPGRGLVAGLGSNIAQGAVDALVAALRQELLSIAQDVEANANSQIGKTYAQLLKDAEPALTEIDRRLSDLDDLLADLQTQLAAQTGPLFKAMHDTLANAAVYQAEVSSAILVAKEDLRRQLQNAIAQGAQWFADHPKSELQDQVRHRVVDAIVASDAMKQVQTLLRQQLASVEEQLQGLLDNFFAEANRVLKPILQKALQTVLAESPIAEVRDALSEQAAKLDAGVNGLAAGLASTLGAASIDGHAVINDQSLRRLRLDGKFAFLTGKKKGGNAPPVPSSGNATPEKDTLELAAWLEFREGDSVGPTGSGGCASPPSSGPEIAFGATCPIIIPVPKSESEPTQRVNGFAEARFLLDTNGLPQQLSGKLGFTGELGIKELKIIDPLVVMAFGVQENYLGAKVRGVLNSVDISASLFLGQVCNATRLRDLQLVDRDTLAFMDLQGLNNAGILVGFYGGGEGRKRLIDGPKSCVLNLEGGIGVATFAFVSGAADVIVGGRFMASVEGEVLCIARVKGELGLAGGIKLPFGQGLGGGLANGTLTLVGRLGVHGEIGVCPFCVGFTKNFGVLLQVSPQHQTLHVDL